MDHSGTLFIMIFTIIGWGPIIIILLLDSYDFIDLIKCRVRGFRTKQLGKWLMNKTIIVTLVEYPGEKDVFIVIDYFSSSDGTWLTILEDHGNSYLIPRDALLILRKHKSIKHENAKYIESITVVEPNKNDICC